jgi:hypothetical protein
VEKWTEDRCPLFHNHYEGDDSVSTALGGLIQTAAGKANGLGSPLTNLPGFIK